MLKGKLSLPKQILSLRKGAGVRWQSVAHRYKRWFVPCDAENGTLWSGCESFVGRRCICEHLPSGWKRVSKVKKELWLTAGDHVL